MITLSSALLAVVLVGTVGTVFASPAGFQAADATGKPLTMVPYSTMASAIAALGG